MEQQDRVANGREERNGADRAVPGGRRGQEDAGQVEAGARRIGTGPDGRDQVQRAPDNAITAEKRDIFLTELGRTLNVSLAAEKAGVSVSGIYRQRAACPVFAEQWEEARDEAFDAISAYILECGRNGVTRIERTRDAQGNITAIKEIETRPIEELMKLLNLNHAKVEARRAERAQRRVAAHSGGMAGTDEQVAAKVRMVLDEVRARLNPPERALARGVTAHEISAAIAADPLGRGRGQIARPEPEDGASKDGVPGIGVPDDVAPTRKGAPWADR